MSYQENNAKRELDITLRSEGDEWVATVADSGPGMDPKDVGKANRGEEIKPNSMGLLLARFICNAHGGEFLVESTKNVGTNVTIRIPVGGR
jgi:sensor histidine kinase regulating citrate/malate metabolism